MSNIWHGSDPSPVGDAGDYELGSVVQALTAVTLNGIRVWSPANAVSRTNRRGHVWSMTGTLLATITMTDALASGWTTHTLSSPMSLDAGDFVVISYESSGNYGATAAALSGDSHVSTDGAMAFPASQAVLVAGSSTTGNGRFNETPASAPNSSFNHTFYGVDADYVAAAGTAPTVTGLTLSGNALEATATITATDPEGLAGATYAVDWGDGATSSGAGTSYSHTYATGGIKAVLASVTDSTGLVGYRAGAVSLVAGTAPTIAQIMAGIETRLNTITGLRVMAYTADQINPPQATVGVPPVENYHTTFQRGRMQLDLEIYIFVSAALDRTGQVALAEYANPTGAKSVIAAIYGDRTLSGTVEDCIVRSFRPLGMEEVGLIGYYGGVFEISVIAEGS